MKQTKTENEKIPVVREYKIGDMTYIVHAVTKDGVKEDAATKIRRMIQNDLRRVKKPENGGLFTTWMQTARRFYAIL